MKFKISTLVLACSLIVVFLAFSASAQDTISTSKVWYASLLKKFFPTSIPIHGIKYPLHTIPCLPQDITKFDVTAEKTDIGLGTAFQVKGRLLLGKIMKPFSVINGVKGKKYMLHLQAYLFSPDGKMIWQQQGFPVGNSWVSAAGDQAEFRLINAFDRSTKGCILIILAAGDPIMSDYDEWRVVLGVKRINL